MARKKTHEEFINEILKYNPTLEVLGTYTYGHNKIKVQCTICKHIWDVEASSIIGKKSTGCPECFRKNGDKKDILDIKKSLLHLLDGDFDNIEEILREKLELNTKMA